MAIGKDDKSLVVIYGATGRSSSSLARRFVENGNEVFMTAIDDTVEKKGNVTLLEYPAVRMFENGIVVANGRHINDISNLESRDARQQLSYALSEEAYEPDDNRTPRITGCVVESRGSLDAALHIVRTATDGIDHASWTVPLTSYTGLFISTYGGHDVNPAPSFKGDPLPIRMSFGSAESAAEAVYASLTPPQGEPDYRVGVCAIYKRIGEPGELAIVNRNL
jgi:IMP cyclohydrolase